MIFFWNSFKCYVEKYLNIKGSCYSFPVHNIYNNAIYLDFYHTISTKYLPIKKELVIETNKIMKIFFKGSNNVLGILARGTDYIACKPRGHPIPPSLEMLIHDIKSMNSKYKYEYLFLSTEDEIIRKQLISFNYENVTHEGRLLFMIFIIISFIK